MNQLTDLEAAGLGCVYRNQPCTAHFVRTQFRQSPSARFSDSAGSVYPTMKRLQTRGLLGSREQEGRRQVRYYECTAAGRAALKRWIGPPLSTETGIIIDPLRTRMLCLKLLTPRQRTQWLAEAERTLRECLEIMESAPASEPDLVSRDIFYEIADENARLGIETRLEWIRRSRQRLRRAGLLEN